MESFIAILPITLCLLSIVLLVVLIILGIKLIISINKANRVLTDVENKLRSLNNFFSIIDIFSDGLSSISNKISENIAIFIGNLFSKKRKKEKEEK
ncbi:MAG: hypothetical protein GX861_02755 [Tenericutes bacterium]|jgi:hypothetical protein|nr:hypothetical protein [Mycoplasmatota bacterium]